MVELIVAMVVIAIALMMLIAVQVSAISTVTEARKLQQATSLANEAVEQMRAMPWQVLSKGMYSGYLTASGGDFLVSGDHLTVDGAPLRILVAPTSNDQNLSEPQPPLFDKFGSHTQVREDPSLAGVDFTVKAYVTEGVDSASSGSLGVAVVVEWEGVDNEVERTFVRSTVHQNGGCGDPATQPYLASCQDYFEASSGTGEIVIGLWATSTDPSDPAGTVFPLTTPDPHDVYRTTVSTAGVFAGMRSQQVTTGEASTQFGGHQTDDNDNASDALLREGYASYTIRATDDGVNPGGLPETATMSPSQGSTVEPETTIKYAGASSGRPQFRIRSDYGRPGSATVDMSGACGITGVPAGQPCSVSSLNHDNDETSGSGYTVLDYAGETFRLARPMNELPNRSSKEKAWTARFITAPGSADTGCVTLTGSGCVAAGSTRTISDVRIADIIGKSWSDGDAPEGLVIVQGGTGCTDNYRDGVTVQRGHDQVAAVAQLDRCGTVRYWTDSGYVDYHLDWDSNTTLGTGEVSWTDAAGDYSITAVSQVRVLPGYSAVTGSADCASESCSVSASPGSISIVTNYVLSWDTHEHGLVSFTDITAPTARASYTAGISG